MRNATDTVELVDDALVENLVRASLFAALIGALSYVSFPFPVSPIPVTLQVLGVFLAAILLGPIWGTVSLCIYLVAGGLGAPIFSMGGAGIGVIVGESGGFLLSFPLATAVMGIVIHQGVEPTKVRTISTVRLVGGMAIGVCIMYSFGVVGMMVVLSLSLWEAFVMGALVFLPAEAAKILAAIGIVKSHRLGNI